MDKKVIKHQIIAEMNSLGFDIKELNTLGDFYRIIFTYATLNKNGKKYLHYNKETTIDTIIFTCYFMEKYCQQKIKSEETIAKIKNNLKEYISFLISVKFDYDKNYIERIFNNRYDYYDKHCSNNIENIFHEFNNIIATDFTNDELKSYSVNSPYTILGADIMLECNSEIISYYNSFPDAFDTIFDIIKENNFYDKIKSDDKYIFTSNKPKIVSQSTTSNRKIYIIFFILYFFIFSFSYEIIKLILFSFGYKIQLGGLWVALLCGLELVIINKLAKKTTEAIMRRKILKQFNKTEPKERFMTKQKVVHKEKTVDEKSKAENKGPAIINNPQKHQILALYCKKCGGKIDNETRQCTSCGKQYFKPINITPKYCKRCGNPVNAKTGRCTSCNKQYAVMPTLKTFLITFLIVVICAVIFIFGTGTFINTNQPRVYISENSTCYHKESNCLILDGSPYKEVSLTEALEHNLKECFYCNK